LRLNGGVLTCVSGLGGPIGKVIGAAAKFISHVSAGFSIARQFERTINILCPTPAGNDLDFRPIVIRGHYFDNIGGTIPLPKKLSKYMQLDATMFRTVDFGAG